MSLDAGACALRLFQRRRVHDLIRAAPDRGEILDDSRLGVQARRILPIEEGVVHPPPEEVSANRPLEVVDEPMYLVVRRGPVEIAALVGDLAIQRHDRCVNQPGDWRDSTIRRSIARSRGMPNACANGHSLRDARLAL